MGLFDRFKKKMPTGKQITDTIEETRRLLEMDIKDIWSIHDRNSFVIAMSGWLNRKCGYGENISTLTPEERIVYIVDTFQAEVNNGGFEQYLYNSSGIFAGDLIPSLTAIGADRTANIYRGAFEKIPCELPADDERRGALLDKVLTEHIAEVLFSCDQQFYEHLDDLDELLYCFIVNHKSSFS